MISQEEKDLILTKLLKEQPNRFMLASAVSKRARQLKEGSKPMVDQEEDQVLMPVIAALEEFGDDKLKIVINEEVSDDQALIDEINQFINAEDEESKEGDDADKKDKKNSKSKSLAS